MIPKYKMRVAAVAALSAGLALRLFFVLQFPASGPGDTPLYEELARNWLYHHSYAIWISGELVPVGVRVPGYPAFLAAVFAVFGQGERAVLLAQAAIDLAACGLVAALSAWVAPEGSRRRAALAGLWLAALCPFVANYSAAVLTEVLASFLNALALVLLLFPGALVDLPGHDSVFTSGEVSFLSGLAVGFGTLVRPETPLLLISFGAVLAWRCRRPRNWRPLVRNGALMAVGLVLPLAPWAVRNMITLGRVQFLAPRYAELPGETVPRGFYSWTATWMWRFRDIYLVPWRLDDEPIPMSDLPAYAFDSPEERARVAALFDDYNENLTLSPEQDRAFAELARERTRRHPMRTWISVPFKRVLELWFTPRIELLPDSGKLWPIASAWQEDPVDFSVTALFGLLNFVFVALAIAGAWRARRQPATVFLVAFLLIRTAFLTTIETPEPRYVLECFPALLALAAQAFTPLAAEL